jgi:hypothetical protein
MPKIHEKGFEFSYNFTMENGIKRNFIIKLSPDKLKLITDPKKNLPEWTKLDYNKCPNCPLDASIDEYCPVAVAIIDILDFFNESISFENVEVRLDTSERSYLKRTNLQSGVSSILGIFMVTSGCPILDNLRPMVRFHLPFATIEETIFRSISMYLVKQYLLHKKGEVPDWDLDGLTKIYNEIHIVNRAFHKRLLHMKGQDANLNALVILDNFANYINFVLDFKKLTNIERLFNELNS